MQLTTKRLREDEMQEYFDNFTKRFLCADSPENVDVEVMSLAWGDQYEVEGARLYGITYDRDTKELDVIFESGEHHVFAISEVWVAEEPNGFINAIQIKRSDGTPEIIRIRPAPLPVPVEPGKADLEQGKAR